MGITGLIPFLEKSSRPLSLREIRNTTVAVDTYCLLHKGTYACAEKLARDEETTVHIQYVMKYVRMLLQYKIKPIMVFDGRHLPAKALTETRRRESRKQARVLAGNLLRAGKVDEARSQFRRCVDITHDMALQVIRECRKLGVDSIVAPYEADAQLAFFNLSGIADYVVTEDSDLLLFGCSRVLFKLDLAGNGLLVDASKIHISMGCRLEKYTFDKFRNMCILSGCDYLDSLPGIGLAKACKFFLLTEETDLRRALPRVPSYLKMKNLTVPPEYIEDFIAAAATFKHMWVFDPTTRQMVRLTDPEDTAMESLKNAGEKLDEKTAFQLALGNLDPFTLKPVDNWDPDAEDLGKNFSIWRKKFVFPSPKRKPRNVEILKAKNHFLGDEKHPVDLATIYLTDETMEKSPAKSPEKSPLKQIFSPPQELLKRNPFRKSLENSSEAPPESMEVSISPSYVSSVAKASSSDSESGQEASQGPRKLSKFCRTVLNQQQNVVSRFWGTQASQDGQNSTQDTEIRCRNEKTPKKSPMAPHLREIYGEEAIASAVKQNLLLLFENDENCQQLPEVAKSPEAIKSPPRKQPRVEVAKCRASGLRKPQQSTPKGESKKMVQSTLSKFGFHRK
ncbi:exonuclease 1 [Lutzomyia longipalpis]|uniref:exonuclease 1 n=1 Tax=Lutzomyia longipalpis TaxID=7200 RepID=UPI0024837A57|nr:exonuclease 1 [Lutzomyia longipalpis]